MRSRRERCSKGHSMDNPYVVNRRDGRTEYQCRPCKKAQKNPGSTRGVHEELAIAKAQIAELEHELLQAYRKLARIR